MTTIRIVCTVVNNVYTPTIMVKCPTSVLGEYSYLVPEIPEMIFSMCLLGDFVQRDLVTELETPDQDIHITRQKQ